MVPEQRDLRPRFLADIIDRPQLPVASARPDPDVYEKRILIAFADAVHHLFNDTCRFCCVEIDNASSRSTYQRTLTLVDDLDRLIRAVWDVQDAPLREQQERQEKLQELRRCEAKAARLRQELGLPDDAELA
jgi:hypothetical protein